MKKGFNILMIGLCIISIVACDKTKSYTDYLNDEKKEIRRLISEKKFEILDNYPADGVFKENQFVQLPTGVYLNVVDSGNGDRAILGQTKILSRFSGEIFFNLDTAYKFNFFTNGSQYFQFTYGLAFAVGQQGNEAEQYFLSPGLESALAFVGDSSVVRMIVPFKSGVGSAYQISNYEPLYYDRVRFMFDK